MFICGHCDAKVSGIRDHIRAAHGFQFYEMGPDVRYYGYEWLKEKDWLDEHQIHPEWDEIIEKGKLRNAVYKRRRQSKV